MTNEKVYALLYPNKLEAVNPRKEPDYSYIQKELAKPGVNLTLLWTEYCSDCYASKLTPYMYTQFCDKYRKWARLTKATMRITHKPGDAMQVDWAGTTIPYYDRVTGETADSYLFAAVLPCSCYAYVEACDDMKTTNWLLCHVHAYEYFGGVTRLLIPDNLKTGVSKKTRYETILNKSYAEILLMKMGIDAPSRNVYNYFITTSGAKVLHNRSVEMAKKYGVELVVRSSLNTEEGTLVKEVAKVEKMLITGVAADKNTARISVMGVEDKPGTAFKIFNTLAKHNINVDIILQSVGRDGTKDITFTVSQDDLKEAMEVMEARKEALTIKEMNYNEKVAKVSIVGAGMLSNPGVAATMFESLSNSNININMISTSEIRITVLIDEKDADRALVAIHDGFGLED